MYFPTETKPLMSKGKMSLGGVAIIKVKGKPLIKNRVADVFSCFSPGMKQPTALSVASKCFGKFFNELVIRLL